MDIPSPRPRFRSPRAIILAVILCAMLFSSVYPLGRYFAVRRDIASLQREEAALDRQIGQLTDEARLLRSDREVERLARQRLGFVRPGETAFVVVPAPGDDG